MAELPGIDVWRLVEGGWLGFVLSQPCDKCVAWMGQPGIWLRIEKRHRPYGTGDSFFRYPALKRWANIRCAYGA